MQIDWITCLRFIIRLFDAGSWGVDKANLFGIIWWLEFEFGFIETVHFTPFQKDLVTGQTLNVFIRHQGSPWHRLITL